MRTLSLTLAACLAFSALALGQEKMMEQPAGVRGSFLKQSKQVEEQLVSLAQAIPQKDFTWRPMKGVRSVSEAFLHVALGNYAVLTTLGGTLPEGVDMKTLQTSTTDKAKIVEELKKSFQAINDCISKVPEQEYGQQVKFFGMDMTKLDMIFLAATHQHETLGQAIAYARTNHVVPPWTAEMQAKMKQEQRNK
jgi:uncharacterized damage-inducible protein DinB